MLAVAKPIHDLELQRRLWTVFEELTGVEYGIA